jgi:hypothetical protein
MRRRDVRGLTHPGLASGAVKAASTRFIVNDVKIIGRPIIFAVVLAMSLGASPAASVRHKVMTCPFLEQGRVTFEIPAKLGAMPTDIDFDYPAKASQFSFRDGNLVLIAMDEAEPTRVRIVISAQINKKTGAYEGQIFVDMGGNQLMLHNGPVRCTVGPA